MALPPRTKDVQQAAQNGLGSRPVSEQPFVNPYNFVPLEDRKVMRGKPAPQWTFGEFSGRIELTLHFETPWFTPEPMRQQSVKDKEHQVRYLQRTHDGRALIPGSSLKGAVRAVAEAFSNSCLPILDNSRFSWRPQKGAVGQKAAIVDRLPTDSEPGELCICDAYKVPFRILTDGLRDGQEIAATIDLQRGKVTKLGSGPVTGILKITEVVGKKQSQRLFVTTNSYENLTQEMVEAYNDGLQPGIEVDERLGSFTKLDREPFAKVEHKHRDGRSTGWRRKRHQLKVKDTVYLRNIDGQNYIGPVELFRVVFSSRVRDALPRGHGHEPCTDGDNLCTCCRLFGWAPAEERRDDKSAVTGYRGRVRFSAAVTDQPIKDDQTEMVTLPPLGQPHASAASFYLNPPANGRGGAASWGDDRIRLRGRKRYYHHNDTAGRPTTTTWDTRDKGRVLQDNQNRTVELASHPSRHSFRAWIDFTGLTAKELGLLLVSVDPRLLGAEALGSRRPQHQLGGGKPLGLGRVALDQVVVTLRDPSERYASLEASGERELDLAEVEEQVKEFALKRLPKAEGDPRVALAQRSEIADLVNLMDTAHAPTPVRYPPGSPEEPEYSHLWFVEVSPSGDPQRREAETLLTPSELAAGRRQSRYERRYRAQQGGGNRSGGGGGRGGGGNRGGGGQRGGGRRR